MKGKLIVTTICALTLLTMMSSLVQAKANKFTTNIYNISNANVLSNLNTKDLTANTVLSNITFDGEDVELKVLNYNGEEIEPGKPVGTNSIIYAMSGGKNIDRLKIVVYGDLTGDGKCNVADALAIVKNRLGKKIINNGNFIEAGRLTKATRENASVPGVADALTIIKATLGKTQISQYYQKKDEITSKMKDAVKNAEDLQTLNNRSKIELQDRLELDGFTTEEALYGANNCNVDWKNIAVKRANWLLENLNGTSRSEMYNYLEGCRIQC